MAGSYLNSRGVSIRRSVRGSGVGIALALLLLCDARVEAGGFHISTLGLRRNAMSTNLAAPDDVSALFHNPAGLADLPGLQIQLTFGLALLDSNTHLQALDPQRFPNINTPGCGMSGAAACAYPIDAAGYYEKNFKPRSYLGAIPFLGFSLALGKYAPRLRGLTVSAAVYAPGAYGASLDPSGPTSYYIVSGLFLVATATVGVGYRINKYVAIGCNLSYNYMRLGLTQKFSTTDALTPNGQAPTDTARLGQSVLGDLNLEYSGTDHGAGWSLGVLLNPTDWLAFGFSYSGWTSPRFDGPARITSDSFSVPSDLGAIVNGFGYKLPKRLIVQMPIPPNVQGGVNFKPRRWVEIGFDARVWLYTLFKREVVTPVYDPTEQGTEPLTEASLSKDKGYSTSYQLNLGVLFRPLRNHPQLEIMAGLGYDKSPTPDRTFSLDSPSFDQVYATTGFREALGPHWRIGAAYQIAAYLERNITTSQTAPPTNVRANALGHFPTLEVSYQR